MLIYLCIFLVHTVLTFPFIYTNLESVLVFKLFSYYLFDNQVLELRNETLYLLLV